MYYVVDTTVLAKGTTTPFSLRFLPRYPRLVWSLYSQRDHRHLYDEHFGRNRGPSISIVTLLTRHSLFSLFASYTR